MQSCDSSTHGGGQNWVIVNQIKYLSLVPTCKICPPPLFGLSSPTTPFPHPQTPNRRTAGYLPNAWIGLVPRCCIGKRRDALVYKRPEPQSEVASELPHLLGKLSAQVPDVVQVILHGQGEVHQVVQVHGIILHLSNLQLEGSLVTCANREALYVRAHPTCWEPEGWSLLSKLAHILLFLSDCVPLRRNTFLGNRVTEGNMGPKDEARGSPSKYLALHF